ncbi:MAG: hypothetical protein JXR36_08610 [Bacteroidales bacterium]|nr:hypothetical protein [Bacteroidales bacterium]
MKKNLLLVGIAVAFALVSCGGAEEKKSETADEQKPICEVENSISVTIKDYMYGMSDTLVFSTNDFNIIESNYQWINDSTVSLKLYNYNPGDYHGSKTEDQIDLNIEINARKGQKLEPGFYGYHDYESGKWSRVTMSTAYGTVWFNWVAGMEDQGGVTIEHISNDAICGTLGVNSEKPDDEMIGTVKVNGTFVHKEAE